MKPQIVTDFEGVHNADLANTSLRLVKGAAWKKQRIVSVIPAGESIPSKVYLSHVNLIYPPNNGVCRILAAGMEVGDAYSNVIGNVLSHPDLSTWEYILTMEHDNMPPQDGVIKLCAQMDAHPELSAISGLYFTKGYGGVAQIWGDINDPVVNFRPVPPRPEELIECHGIGMGFALWRLSMFKDERLRKPWFKTQPTNTQDLYAWMDLKKHGFRCAVDCSVKVGHYDSSQDMVW